VAPSLNANDYKCLFESSQHPGIYARHVAGNWHGHVRHEVRLNKSIHWSKQLWSTVGSLVTCEYAILRVHPLAPRLSPMCGALCSQRLPTILLYYVYNYMYILCIHVCVCTYTYIHIHTYIPYHTIPYHTIHYIALHYITLHYSTLLHYYITTLLRYYITTLLHYITLYYITLYYIHGITLHYITIHNIT